MKIKTITYQHSSDFSADMECEHCGHVDHITTGYDDDHYHSKVIPGMRCSKCGLPRHPKNAARAIADALSKQCITTQVKQAAIVGEAEGSWSLYLSGAVRPGEAKIEAWVNLASEKTGSPIRINFFEGEWVAN